MAKISRSRGSTESERYLARLAERTFLDLWSYPNVYRDTIVNGRRVGKELCDLLVVCGDHVIIFSDKRIEWPGGTDINLAWMRWYKRAVKKSVDQVRGAERWIAQYPDRLFLDLACTQPLPIRMPPPGRRRVSGVVVAIGAHDACQAFFNGDSGSFMVRPSLQGEAHMNTADPDFVPFVIGDVDPSGAFVHVLNDLTLDVIMRELDTITDFAEYLERKAAFVRSGNLIGAAGEEELLANYMTHMIGGQHNFVHPENRPWKPTDGVYFDQGFYAKMLENDQYKRKKEADQSSYIWDRLIGQFTRHMLDGTTINPNGGPFILADHEIAVRHMAHESRVARRGYGEALLGVLKASHKQPRSFRAMIPPPDDVGNGTGYAFLTLALPEATLKGGYEQYRQARVNLLYAYCLGMIKKCRYLKRMIGIATEPPSPGGTHGSSEDMVMVEPPEQWTPEFEGEVENLLEEFDILKESRVRRTDFHTEEFPEAASDYKSQFALAPAATGLNRHERRAMRAKMRRREHKSK